MNLRRLLPALALPLAALAPACGHGADPLTGGGGTAATSSTSSVTETSPTTSASTTTSSSTTPSSTSTATTSTTSTTTTTSSTTTTGTLPTGDVGWARVIGGDGWDEARGLVVTAQGEVILAGQIEYAVDAGCGPLAAKYRDILLGAYSASDGSCHWNRIWGTPNDDGAQSLALGPAGELYLGGSFNDLGNASVDFGGGALAGSGANRDVPFVARFTLSAAGPQHDWSIRFLGDGSTTSLAPFAGGVVAAGQYYQSLVVNGNQVARCCPDGDATWIASITGGTASWGNGVRVTASGLDSVYPGPVVVSGSEAWLSATAAGPAEMGPAAAPVPAGPLVARFALSGGTVSGIAPVAPAQGTPVFVGKWLPDPAGGFLVAGTADEGADLGNGALVGYGEHIYVGHVDTAGKLTSAQTFHIEYGGVSGLVRDASGRVVVLGAFRGTRSFGAFSLTSGSTNDFAEDPFVMVLSPDLGSVLHAERFSTPGEDFMGGHLALSPAGTWIVAQHFTDTITVRGHTYNGPHGWNVLLMDLR